MSVEEFWFVPLFWIFLALMWYVMFPTSIVSIICVATSIATAVVLLFPVKNRPNKMETS